MPLAEALDPLVVADQGAGDFDRGGDQQSIGWVPVFQLPVFQVMELVAAACGRDTQGHSLHRWTIETPPPPGQSRGPFGPNRGPALYPPQCPSPASPHDRVPRAP